MEKTNFNEVILVGGVGEKKSNGGTQYFQQDRIYSRFGSSPAINASLRNGGVVKKWKKSESANRSKTDI